MYDPFVYAHVRIWRKPLRICFILWLVLCICVVSIVFHYCCVYFVYWFSFLRLIAVIITLSFTNFNYNYLPGVVESFNNRFNFILLKIIFMAIAILHWHTFVDTLLIDSLCFVRLILIHIPCLISKAFAIIHW